MPLFQRKKKKAKWHGGAKLDSFVMGAYDHRTDEKNIDMCGGHPCKYIVKK